MPVEKNSINALPVENNEPSVVAGGLLSFVSYPGHKRASHNDHDF